MNLRDFENWALAQGSVANPEPDNSHKGQCVSLVQQYLSKVHNIPFQARGNGKDWAYTNIPGFTKINVNNSVKPGDILVYGATRTNQYGHVALIDADGRFLEQNKNGAKKVTVGSIRAGRIAILRPNKVDLGITTTAPIQGKIADIQRTLNSRYGFNIAVDNIAGNQTKKAIVMALQKELNKQYNKGVVVDGIFGNQTKSACVTLRKGAQGNITWLLQARLVCLGYNTNGGDGVFGNYTLATVKQFQRTKGIVVDGVVGKQTWSKLLA